MCRAACAWVGIRIHESEVERKTLDFMLMVDAFGGVDIRYWRGKLARGRIERWIKRRIAEIRNGKLNAAEDTVAHIMAHHRNLNGQLFDTQVAAVELINIIRPIVAIGWYVSFAALALHEQPEYRKKIQEGDDTDVELFVQEVRRFYPFAPFLGARVRSSFNWHGYDFKKGTLVLLDVFGMLHDSRLWESPEMFNPERFRHWKGSPFDFIPQGGGDHYTGHRCAGEWITIEAMKVAFTFLTKFMEYQVPNQDLSYSLKRMPTFPRSGFVINKIEPLDNSSVSALKFAIGIINYNQSLHTITQKVISKRRKNLL